MKFSIQESINAFNSAREVPDSQWHEMAQAETYSQAKNIAADLHKAMVKRIGGLNSWDSHRRIVALVDVTLTFTAVCPGWIGGDNREWCFNEAPIRIQLQAGEAVPNVDAMHPEEWGGSLCPSCRAKENFYEAEMDGRLPGDLITQAQAVEIGAPSVQAVNNAIRDGRLTGYKNPDADHHKRQGATLVSQSAVRRLWQKQE